MSTSPPPAPRRASSQPRARSVAAVRPKEHPRQRLLLLGAIALGGAVVLGSIGASRVTAQDWQISEIEQGTKPALSLTPDGDPIVIYMLERQDGWVRVASLNGGEWNIDEVASGYFYGPPDIAVGDDGVVHAAYHDHQGQSFDPAKGDAVYLRRDDAGWTSTAAADAGHDGWDNRITVDATGRPHMVGIDPLEFNGSGVEYYGLSDDGTWVVEQLGSGPQTYKYATSIAVDPDGTPWITYHDGSTGELKLAQRTADGWDIQVVDDRGDTGLFSELIIDMDGGQHISYFEKADDTSGKVRYAFRPDAGSAWEFADIDTLGAMFFGFTGARNITSLALDENQQPSIAYSDESILKLAQLVDGEWQLETVAETSADTPFGQIVSLELDDAGLPHIAYSILSSKGPLDGTIAYATRG